MQGISAPAKTIQDRPKRRHSTSQDPNPSRGPSKSTYSGRETPILRTGIEMRNIRPLGSGGGEGLLARPGTNPLPDQPSAISGQNLKRAQKDREEIQNLVSKKVIEVAHPQIDQFVSRLFVIPKKDGSLHPVINLKPLNRFVAKCHFKMDGTCKVKE